MTELIDRAKGTRGIVNTPVPEADGWSQSLLALVPFLFIPVIFSIGQVVRLLVGENPAPGSALPVIGLITFFLPVAWILVSLGISAARGFPRWTMPYWGLALVITLYLVGFSGTIGGIWVEGSWLVWLPVLAVTAIGLVAAGRSAPVQRFLKAAWGDWTRLSFLIYGALPPLLLAAYDEVHDQEGLRLLGHLALAGGALLYMRSHTIWQRGLSLLGGLGLGWGLAALNLAGYWGGRQEAWMTQPGDWGETLVSMSRAGGMLMALMMAPILIWGMRSLAGRFKFTNSSA
jgi:hypothetical protein